MGHPGVDGVLLLTDLRHRPGHAGVGGLDHPRLPLRCHPDHHRRKHPGKANKFPFGKASRQSQYSENLDFCSKSRPKWADRLFIDR